MRSLGVHRVLARQARSCVRDGQVAGRVRVRGQCHQQLACLHSSGEGAGGPVSPEHFQWLKLEAPEFRVNGDDIKVLHEPSEFYQTLKESIESSKEKIVLASLYLGNGPMEAELVQALHGACDRAQRERDPLNVHVLLDCVRGSRGTKNSRTMLLPLLRDFGSRVSVSLYHTPELRGIKKAFIPQRFNEAIGLSHLKVYAFDDTLLMSGANLSEMYFTNRQDRYILIRNCPQLVGFFSRLVLAVSSLAFQLHPDNSLSLYAEDSIHPVKGDLNEFKVKGYTAIGSVLESAENENPSQILKQWQKEVLDRRPGCNIPGSREVQGTSELHHKQLLSRDVDSVSNHKTVLAAGKSVCGNNSLVPAVLREERTAHSAECFEAEGNHTRPGRESNGHGNREDTIANDANIVGNSGHHSEMSEDLDTQRTSNHGEGSANLDDGGARDTAIFPLVQMGPLGITVDQEVTRRLLGDREEESVCYLASGYFNLTSEYMDTILGSRPVFEILMASPQVNGFYGSRGISGYIPDSYTFISRQFYRAVSKRGQQRRIRLYEYHRDAWTFHVKGLWYYLPHQALPSLTLIGSPNFGHRSVHRDLEAQLAIVTDNQSLRNQLHQEQERMYALSSRVSESTYRQPQRRVPLWTRLVTIVTRNFF